MLTFSLSHSLPLLSSSPRHLQPITPHLSPLPLALACATPPRLHNRTASKCPKEKKATLTAGSRARNCHWRMRRRLSERASLRWLDGHFLSTIIPLQSELCPPSPSLRLRFRFRFDLFPLPLNSALYATRKTLPPNRFPSYPPLVELERKKARENARERRGSASQSCSLALDSRSTPTLPDRIPLTRHSYVGVFPPCTATVDPFI